MDTDSAVFICIWLERLMATISELTGWHYSCKFGRDCTARTALCKIMLPCPYAV